MSLLALLKFKKNYAIFKLNDLYPDPGIYDGSMPTVTILFPFNFWMSNTICISEVFPIKKK